MASKNLCALFLVATASLVLADKWPLYDKDVGAVPASFDCAMRKTAYEYGKQLIPRQGTFESLFYALDLNDPSCKTEISGPRTYNHPIPASVPKSSTTVPKNALFVHPTEGSDSNSGSITNPLATIQAAMDQSIQQQPPTPIVLRGGTHYLTDTLHFGPQHSDLEMMGYPGETAKVSGGVQLKVSWKPYNVTPAPPSPPGPPAPAGWVTQDGYNYVYGADVGSGSFPLLGKVDNKTACQMLCQKMSGCHAYTWHDDKQGSYARDCVGRTDGHYNAKQESGHYSGHDGSATPSSGPGPSPPAPPAGPPNIYVADISGQVTDVPGLQLNGARATRARYPNLPWGIEASCGYGCMISGGSTGWVPPNMTKFGNVTFYTDNITAHNRDDTPDNWFQHYMIGIGGPCAVYDPPVSYWCSEHPSGGGAFSFRTPSGIIPKQGELPHSPYKDPSQALFFVWRPSRWANWMFEIDTFDASSNTYKFGKGGNQGARGNNNGGDWFIENVMEELDYPNEFFFDKKTSKLYLWYNGTGAPPSDMTVVAPQKQVLVNMTGTQWNPVKNVKTSNIMYTASAYTYMMPHGVPSAGDWALDRYGAVFIQGAEGVTFDNCTFERLDGNGVMVSGYNRNTTISNSDFSYIGGNAIAAWGYTNETEGYNHPIAGVDGTDGNHPRYTTVLSNTAREVGLYEKQSSFFIEAKTAQSIIIGNVFFNGPRAGINANDGFGGGDEIAHNLVFSTCRESGDHGPFNSWDRQPFLTTVRTGQPSMIMQWREIHHNFFIDNYSPQENVDNDDGSCFYHTHDNFLVYGNNGMKNDFGGHDNHHIGNIYAYVGHGLGVCGMLDGHEDYFQNNQVVTTGTSVGSPQCKSPGKTVMGNNSYYTSTGKIEECGTDLKSWQKQSKDNEPGSTVAMLPSDDTIIGWAKAKLMIQ